MSKGKEVILTTALLVLMIFLLPAELRGESLPMVSVGGNVTVGLKSDGTVLAVGYISFDDLQELVTWTDIVQVDAGGDNIVGLRSDGTVLAVGDNQYGQLDHPSC